MKRTLSDLTFVVLPKLLGGAGIFLVNILLLRYLGPEQFGLYSLCVTGILLSEGVLGTPFDIAVLRLAQASLARDEGRAIAIERQALKQKLPLAVAMLALALAASGWLLPSASSGNRWVLVAISGSAVIAMLLQRSILTHLQIRQRFVRYGITDLMQIVVKFGGIALLLLFFPVRPEYLIAFLALGPALSALFGGLYFARPLFTHPATRVDRESLWEHAKWYFATIGLGATIGRLDILMLGSLAPLEQVGVFAAAQVIAMIPELLGGYASVVLSPRIIPHCRRGDFRRFFIEAQMVLTIVAVGAYVAALLLWDDIATHFLPSRYREASELLMILLPGTLAGMVTAPLALPFVLFVKKRLIFMMDLWLLPFLLILYYFLIDTHGALGAAIVVTTSHLLRSLLVLSVAWRLSRRDNPLQLRSETDIA